MESDCQLYKVALSLPGGRVWLGEPRTERPGLTQAGTLQDLARAVWADAVVAPIP